MSSEQSVDREVPPKYKQEMSLSHMRGELDLQNGGTSQCVSLFLMWKGSSCLDMPVPLYKTFVNGSSFIIVGR